MIFVSQAQKEEVTITSNGENANENGRTSETKRSLKTYQISQLPVIKYVNDSCRLFFGVFASQDLTDKQMRNRQDTIMNNKIFKEVE